MSEVLHFEGEVGQPPIPYPGRWIDEVASGPVEGYSTTLAAGKPAVVRYATRNFGGGEDKAPAIIDVFDELQAGMATYNNAMAHLTHLFSVPTDPFVSLLSIQMLFGAKARYLQPAVQLGLPNQIGLLFEGRSSEGEQGLAPMKAESFSHMLDFLIAQKVSNCPSVGVNLSGEFSAVWFETSVGKVTAEFRVDGMMRLHYLVKTTKGRQLNSLALGDPRLGQSLPHKIKL